MRTTLRVLVIPLTFIASVMAGGGSGPEAPGRRHLPATAWLAGTPPPLDTMGRPDTSSRDSSMRDTTWRDTVPDTLPKPKPKPKRPHPPRKPS